MKKILCPIVVAAIVLASCGSSSGSGSGSSPSSSPGPSSSSKSLAAIQDRMTEGGVDCEGKPGPYQAHANDISFGIPDPAEALECTTPDGVEVVASRWDDKSDMQAALSAMKSMFCSSGGGNIAFVTSGAALISTNGDTMTKADYGTIKKIGKALDEDVTEPCENGVDEGALADGSGELGKPVNLGDGTTITLSNPRVGGDDSAPWITVDATFKNNSSTTAQSILPAIICHGTDETGGWLANSTYDAGAEVKPGKTLSGTLELLTPGSHRTGDATPQCAAPAKFQLGVNGPTIDIPQAIIDDFNAKARASKPVDE